MPQKTNSGMTRVLLVNQGQDVHEAVLVRVVAPGGTARDYVDQWKKGISWPAFGSDVGGVALTAPGDSNEVWLKLEPGRYLVICTKGDHLDRGMAGEFEVEATNEPMAAPPVADLRLELFDYAFRFPKQVPAGRRTIHVVNRGTEPHEMDIYRIPEGRSIEDWIAWSRKGEPGEPPLELAGGGGDFFPGREEWFPVNLTPGRYLILCSVTKGMQPGGAPHYALGMLWYFQVE